MRSGIADAIATRLGALKGNKTAIAETIENNVRSTILKASLTDPAYYERMSTLLDEVIADRRAKAIEYEEYLKRIAELAQSVEAGLADDAPEQLKSNPALRALYNNLKNTAGSPVSADGVAETPSDYMVSGDPALDKAMAIDAAVKKERPDGWRGVHAKEQIIKAALYGLLQDEAEVERIFSSYPRHRTNTDAVTDHAG